VSRLYAAGGGSRPEDRSYGGLRGAVSMRSPSVKRRCRGNLSRCGITQLSRAWHASTACGVSSVMSSP
jgi:hypothetical protein